MSVSPMRLKRVALVALALVLAARAISMALLPLTDPTEGRYAQVAQEMVCAGDWVTPYVWMNETHLPFLGKPPLYFWAAAGAMKLLGVNEFSARLPSFVAALALLWLLNGVMRRYGNGEGSGLLSVMVTASCGFFVAVCGSVAVDTVFSACVAGSLLAYVAFLNEADRSLRLRWSLLVFLLLALGFLTKGPVALVLFGLPVLIWTIRWRAWDTLRDHCWIAGSLLFLALVVPWFVLCENHNPGFLKYFFVNENVLRYVKHDYGDAYGSGHVRAHGTALLMFAAATAPWSLLGLWRAARGWRAMRAELSADKRVSFLLLGFVAGTLFWCLARQLLVTYLLPMVPLFAAWLVLTTRDETARRRVLAATTALVAAMALVCVACVPFLLKTSTARPIVREALRLEAGKTAREPLLFAQRTPYSALFYARGWVLPHPVETLNESLARYRGKGHSALVVVPNSGPKSLQGVASEGWPRLASVGKWALIRATVPASAD